MKNNATNKPGSATNVVVIPDECGDTMWDAVLQQEVKCCGVQAYSHNTAPLLKNIDVVKVCDATEAQ